MDPRMHPEESFSYVRDRLDAYRHEAATNAIGRCAARSRQSAGSRTVRRAIGHFLVGFGHALAGEPAR